ncbi:MAG: formyltransferase family protein, partial [Planctomycetota bacterium]
SRLVLDDYWLANRVLNIHPSLLPSFGGKGMYGRHVHEAVLARGCKVTGCTVHYVNNEVDGGPIIAQRCLPVKTKDAAELEKAVQYVERELFPSVLAELSSR